MCQLNLTSLPFRLFLFCQLFFIGSPTQDNLLITKRCFVITRKVFKKRCGCDTMCSIIIICDSMSNTALLVDCHKIITWLQDRKKLRKDWYNYLKAGEEKLKALLKDREWTINYPNIHDYLNDNEHNFNYNDISRVVELLLQTDIGQQKNLLFGYSDKRVKEWTTLKKYMEGNTLNLLSLAKFIEQSLRFDLPGLNKSIESYDTQLTTLKRKIDFNNNTIFQQSKELTKDRAALGIQSEQEQKISIQKLIASLVERGPEQIKKFECLVRQDNIKKYIKFYNQICDRNEAPNRLKTLEYFIQNGDEFLEIYKDSSKKQVFSAVRKYKEFEHWKGSNEWEIQIQGEDFKEKISINHMTVVENRQFRQNLMYELNQLLFFFKGVRQELMASQKGLGIDAEHGKSQLMVEGQAAQAIDELQKVISFLTSKRLTGPLELKNSKKAYQLLVSQFMGYEANISTMQTQIRSYKEQIVEFEQRRMKEVEKLNWLRAKVSGCKGKCEGWMCELIKREVKITGQINKLE